MRRIDAGATLPGKKPPPPPSFPPTPTPPPPLPKEGEVGSLAAALFEPLKSEVLELGDGWRYSCKARHKVSKRSEEDDDGGGDDVENDEDEDDK